jgi:hypothetical protein
MLNNDHGGDGRSPKTHPFPSTRQLEEGESSSLDEKVAEKLDIDSGRQRLV